MDVYLSMTESDVTCPLIMPSAAKLAVSIDCQEFEMDPEIKKELLRQKSARIDVVKKEMAWEAARHDLALRKLESRSVRLTSVFFC